MSTIVRPERTATLSAARLRLEGPILVATDGTQQSAGAFAAAVGISTCAMRRIEGGARLPVHVITVCGALPVVVPEMVPAVAYSYADVRRNDMLAAAREQVRNNVGDSTGWRIDAASGAAVPTITDLADEDHASLVVMGLGKHDLADRVFGTETAVRVMQHSRAPVLAVPQNWIGIPRRVLIAVDFGPASLRAAQTAMCIVAPGASVCFTHVGPMAAHPAHSEQLLAIYQGKLNEELDQFIDAVGVPDDVTVTRVPLYGDTASTLLEFARTENIDMIVAGTHGRNALSRLVAGSVATSIVRGAQCAVLVASSGIP
jgi:nucleotide-binding universal stress UspA family protein